MNGTGTSVNLKSWELEPPKIPLRNSPSGKVGPHGGVDPQSHSRWEGLDPRTRGEETTRGRRNREGEGIQVFVVTNYSPTLDPESV